MEGFGWDVMHGLLLGFGVFGMIMLAVTVDAGAYLSALFWVIVVAVTGPSVRV